MLNARNLDDQTYQEIVTSAEGRLPWLCPVWTDHNAHDPGITILELMAWYKEMQQYHMNQFTDALRYKLLKLAGVSRRPAAPAGCAVDLPPGGPSRLAGERLTTREGIPFELTEAIPPQQPVIDRIQVVRGERRVDVGALLDRHVTFLPFDEEEDSSAQLYIGLSGPEADSLRLWFDVEPPTGSPRNPFSSLEQVPRLIRWTCLGAAETLLLQDETHALSVSGYVTLRPEGGWPAGDEGLRWLVLTLEDPGCEERVRLSGLSAGRWPALQQETWAQYHTFCAPSQSDWTVCLADALARDGELAIFIRTAERWTQTDAWQAAATQDGRVLLADTSAAVQDGADNVMVVALDGGHSSQLLFDAKGLPGECFFLDLEGRTALTESFVLLCDTLDRDGQIRPALWRCVDDLYACGPRDRVFTYDPVRETITFGDGEHGALLRRGEGSVLVAGLALTYGSGGNIPGGTELTFQLDGLTVLSQAAQGGRDQETAAQTQARLLQMLDSTRKCVSAADYERLAKETPGLRVAAAKALPGYDPDEPTGVSRLPTVTVVAVPAGTGPRPLPDHRFLAAVQRQMDRVRPIGTQVKVVPPVYVGLQVDLTLRAGEEADDTALRQSLSGWLERCGIGGVLRSGEAWAAVQAIPGVLQVREITLRTTSPGCYQNEEGDIFLPRQAIPILDPLRVARLSERRSSR